MKTRVPLALLPLLMMTTWATETRAFVLPYATRTKDYSSWTPATQGDTNTIGMAGATVALPMSISSAQTNPAGYAMMTGSISAQINSTNYTDQRLQRTGDTISASQWGFGISPEHWGFALSYYSPQTETGTYVAPNIGDTAKTEVSLKELRLTAARSLWNDSVAIGLSLEIAKAVREINDTSSNSFGPSFQLGALYRTRNHVLLGASYQPELSVGPSNHPDPQNAIPGFNRAVVRPALFNFGAGWVPNRFFKLGLTVTYAASTQNTALLYDEMVATGTGATWVPRLGLSYVVAEYSNFKVEAASGSYYESSRLSNQTDRLHFTAGLEANPSFINLGGGFDVAVGYHNYLVSVGIDIVRTARFFNIIPPEHVAPYEGLFPRITRLSPDGLPSGLTADEHKEREESLTDVGKIVSEVPGNVAKKFEGEKTTVEERGAPEPSLKGMLPDVFHKKSLDEKAAEKEKRDAKNKKKKGRKSKPAPKGSPSPYPAPSVFPEVH